MNGLNYLFVRILSRFTWVKIENPPRWVIYKAKGYYKYFCDKYGHPPYDQRKTFKGKHYLYRVYYETIEQGRIRERFFVTRRGLI